MLEGKATLECKTLSVRYGQHLALDQVSIQVSPGEIVVILGANGAGKTSLLNALGGRISCADSSQIILNGELITHAPANLIVEKGLALVPEGRGIFADLSVRENLLLGAYAKRARSAEVQNLARVLALFPQLAERKSQIVRTMSGGEQQMVAIGRALMSAPSLLMLDEPSLGLSPLLCSELFRSLQSIRSTDVGILLVEQNARQALAIADRAYLLENGIIVGHGSAQDLAKDPAVKAAYLGGASGQRSGAVSAAADTDHTGPPPISISQPARPNTDELIGTPLEDLVARADAASKMAVHTQANAVPNRLQPPSPVLAKGEGAENTYATASLQSMLSDIEAAAVRARSHKNGENDLPVIEIYRRPRIEIYRRDITSKRLVRIK